MHFLCEIWCTWMRMWIRSVLNRDGGGVFVAVLMSRRVKEVWDCLLKRLVSVFFALSFLSFFFKCFPWGTQLSWHENTPGILQTKSTDITDTHTTSVICTDWFAVIWDHLWKLILHFSNLIQFNTDYIISITVKRWMLNKVNIKMSIIGMLPFCFNSSSTRLHKFVWSRMFLFSSMIWEDPKIITDASIEQHLTVIWSMSRIDLYN